MSATRWLTHLGCVAQAVYVPCRSHGEAVIDAPTRRRQKRAADRGRLVANTPQGAEGDRAGPVQTAGRFWGRGRRRTGRSWRPGCRRSRGARDGGGGGGAGAARVVHRRRGAADGARRRRGTGALRGGELPRLRGSQRAGAAASGL